MLLDYGDLSDLFKQALIEVISSFPALYTVLFLDEATYGMSAIPTLANDVFPLNAYPSRDKTAPQSTRIPTTRRPRAAGVRYPTKTGFDLVELDYARLQFQQLARAMAPNLAQRFYHLRGVRTQGDSRRRSATPGGSVTWDWIRPRYDATDPSPIADGDRRTRRRHAAGLVGAPRHERAGPLHHRQGERHHHMFHESFRDLDARVDPLRTGSRREPTLPPPPDPASHEDVIDFLRWLAATTGATNTGRTSTSRRCARPGPSDLREKSAGSRPHHEDIMKRPAPPGPGPAGGAARPDRRAEARPAQEAGPEAEPRKRRPGPGTARRAADRSIR